MADKKVTALSDLGDNLAAGDLFHVVDDPTGTPINKKITSADVFNNIPSFLGLKQASQAITADGSTATAVDVLAAVTEINATSATHSAALADGAEGQMKTIINVSTSGTNAITITPTNRRGYSSITLNKQGETITLLFKNSKWNVFAEGNGATVNA